MQEKSMVKSAFILTMGNVIAKVIGVIYVFLFANLVSSQGLALYSYAYTPYVIFLDLATLGIPVGIMKLISSKPEGEQLSFSYELYLRIRYISLFLGLFMFMMMFLLSDYLASLILAGEEVLINRVEDVSRVIKLISFALIIIPNLALQRGIFNSMRYTMITARSQVIEQMIRVGIILTSAYLIIVVFKQSYVYAIYVAVLAAGISGLITFLILHRRLQNLLGSPKVSGIKSDDFKKLLKTVVQYSIPVVLMTLLLTLYNLIDTLTFNQAFLKYKLENSEIIYATYAFEVNKLIMLPTALGASFGMSLIVYRKNRADDFQQQIIKACQTLCFVIIPIVMLYMVYHQAIYTGLYSSKNPYGPAILLSAAPLVLLYSYLNMTNGIMQSLGKEWTLIISLVCGVCIKTLYNTVLIGNLGVNGAILATYIGLLATLIINFIIIKLNTKLNLIYLIRRLLFNILVAGILAAVMYWLNFYLFKISENYTSRLFSLGFLFVNSLVYLLLYLLTCYGLGLLDVIIGQSLNLKQLILQVKTYVKKSRSMV